MPLEIWTRASGGVMVSDPASGATRMLEDVQSIVFSDGSAFPPRKDIEEEPVLARLLSGQPLRVRR